MDPVEITLPRAEVEALLFAAERELEVTRFDTPLATFATLRASDLKSAVNRIRSMVDR
jgi:hypothetical protein